MQDYGPIPEAQGQKQKGVRAFAAPLDYAHLVHLVAIKKVHTVDLQLKGTIGDHSTH